MKFTKIRAYGRPVMMWCDEKCHKAWGIATRPTKQLSIDDNDVFFIGDKDLDNAPKDPGTYEGGHCKPLYENEKHNKWCFRQCERSKDTAEFDRTKIKESDFNYLNQGWYNMPNLESNQKIEKL